MNIEIELLRELAKKAEQRVIALQPPLRYVNLPSHIEFTQLDGEWRINSHEVTIDNADMNQLIYIATHLPAFYESYVEYREKFTSDIRNAVRGLQDMMRPERAQ